MSFNHTFAPHSPRARRTLLVGAIMLALGATASPLYARDLIGTTAEVNPGDPSEQWVLSGDALLTVNPGGATAALQSAHSSIVVNGGSVSSASGPNGIAVTTTSSSFTMTGSTVAGEARFDSETVANISNSTFTSTSANKASGAVSFVNSTGFMRDSTVTATSGYGISVNTNLAGTPEAPMLTLINSDVTALSVGARVGGGGTLTLDQSRVTSLFDAGPGSVLDNNGAMVVRGTLVARNNSLVNGATNGVGLLYLAGTGSPGTETNLIVDNSRIVGQTGAAISVGGFALTPPTIADIQILNGATLQGGNGNLLQVTDGATANMRVGAADLTGNVFADPDSTANLTFQNNASLTGALTNVTSLALADTSRWNVTADSTVGTLNLGSGTLAFAAPSPGYKTVTVGGDMSVNGGTLIFNSVLAGDGSPSDKLVVGGNTSGSGNIVVNNIGGAGAQTSDGIQLISVAGTSGATFAMNGRATGGVYEYLLYKGGVTTPSDGGWYLRSAYTGDPCDLNPSLPICAPVDPTDPTDPVTPVDPITPDPTDPVPVLRPEPGAYLANQAAAVRMFQQRRHDRGEPAFEHDGIGAWARVSRDQLRTTIAGQVDARSQTNALQIGSDVFRWGQVGRGQVGVMLATGDADTQATSRITGYGTRGKVKGDAVGVYGTWVQSADDSAGLYVDGWLQYGRYDSWVQGDGLAREKYDATTRAASVEAGYGFALSNSERRSIYLQPQVQVSYTDYKGDTLQEVNGTIVEDDTAGGLETRVGVRLFGHDNATGNRVQPFFAVNWLYNERGDAMRFDGETLEARLPTNRYEAQAGAQLRLGERWSAWGDLRVQRGDSGYKDAGAQLGLRRAW